MTFARTLELDHIFVFTSRDGRESKVLEDAGLVETYRRRHRGQGTANACHAFDNAFLELLWIEDKSEVESMAIRRCQFTERAGWRDTAHINPFGLAWRGAASISTWPLHPPYLPPQAFIPVALDSDDVGQPFMFTFPGALKPSDWPPERRGALQRDVGFSTLHIEAMTLATIRPPSSALVALFESGVVERLSLGECHQVVLRLERQSGGVPARLVLPEFRWL